VDLISNYDTFLRILRAQNQELFFGEVSHTKSRCERSEQEGNRLLVNYSNSQENLPNSTIREYYSNSAFVVNTASLGCIAPPLLNHTQDKTLDTALRLVCADFL
jgi:hypothetical protein